MKNFKIQGFLISELENEALSQAIENYKERSKPELIQVLTNFLRDEITPQLVNIGFSKIVFKYDDIINDTISDDIYFRGDLEALKILNHLNIKVSKTFKAAMKSGISYYKACGTVLDNTSTIYWGYGDPNHGAGKIIHEILEIKETLRKYYSTLRTSITRDLQILIDTNHDHRIIFSRAYKAGEYYTKEGIYLGRLKRLK